MTYGYILLAVPFVLALVSLIIAARSFMQKGMPINTRYLFSSQMMRDAMDKKPLYRQSGIAFLFITGVFISMGLDVISDSGIFLLMELGFMIATAVYIILSNKKMN